MIKTISGIIRNMKTLYPEIEPFESGMLKVSDIHEIYYERAAILTEFPLFFCTADRAAD